MSKVTDLLIDTMAKAEKGDGAGVEANLATLRDRHDACCAELLPEKARAKAMASVHLILDEFSKIARGMLMLGERPPQTSDRALAMGERLSAVLITACLQTQKIPARFVNGERVIATDDVFGNASPLMEETRLRAEKVVRPLLKKNEIVVMTGFNGSTLDERPTTLGRGGSDFSASILAAALDAEELWIWTDVDGIMTGDPRLVPEARVMEAITYAEAAELAYAGAKVLHPRTMAPLVERKIPVWSKNSFAPEKPGTRIVPELKRAEGAHAVTSMTGVALISIEPTPKAASGTKLMAEAIDALAAAEVEVLAFTSSSSRQSFCFLLRQSELKDALDHLEETFHLELEHGHVNPIQVDKEVGLIAVVGAGMRGQHGLAGQIFTAISKEKINIIAIAQGSSELTIAIVVRREGLERAVCAVHQACIASSAVTPPKRKRYN